MSDLLKVQDLHMWIQTDKGLNHILQGVQLDIRPGEIHGLIGESGCGKTMMTKATLNLIDPKRTVICPKRSVARWAAAVSAILPRIL